MICRNEIFRRVGKNFTFFTLSYIKGDEIADVFFVKAGIAEQSFNETP